jgi:tetratricopeptide (TPR) repeat protein
MLQRALKSYDAIEDGFLYRRTTQRLGNVYFKQGKLVEAEIMYKRAAKSYDALEDYNKSSYHYEQMIEVLSGERRLYATKETSRGRGYVSTSSEELRCTKDSDKQDFRYEQTIEVLSSRRHL